MGKKLLKWSFYAEAAASKADVSQLLSESPGSSQLHEVCPSNKCAVPSPQK